MSYDMIADAVRRRLWLYVSTAALVGLAAGCEGGRAALPTGKVAGTVTLRGEPLTEGRINFVSESLGVGAGGDVQSDGTYVLEGAVPIGEYKVFLTFSIAPVDIGTPAEAVMKSVPKKYLDQTTSGLVAEVPEGESDSSFELE